MVMCNHFCVGFKSAFNLLWYCARAEAANHALLFHDHAVVLQPVKVCSPVS
jgi:hypothetical protein